MNVSQEKPPEKSLFDKRVFKNECITESDEWIIENPNMDDNIFNHFSLKNFLDYNFNCIHKGTLIKFANALKVKVFDKIIEFEPLYREQLEVLCQITDGNQTERNQNIITKRMLDIVRKTKIYSKHRSNSQNAVSQDDLLSTHLERNFSSSRKTENIKESEIKPSFAASETNKDYFNEKRDAESNEVKTTEFYNIEKKINASEEWVLETPSREVKIIESLNTDKKINSLEEEWVVKTPSDEVKIIESLNTDKKINTLEEEWVVKTPVCIKDTVSTSQGGLATKSITNNRTFHKVDDFQEYVEWNGETPPYQNFYTKSNDTAIESKELTIKSFSKNKSAKQSFSNRATPEMTNIINTSEEWTITSPVKNDSYSEFGEINKPHYNCSEEEWTYPVKVEISNEKIDSREQRFHAGECISSGKNWNSNSKERRYESSNFAGRSMQRFFSDIRNKPRSNKSNEWRPNVKAEGFFPGKKKLSSKFDMYPDNSTFGHFPLIDLLNYDVDLMPSDELKNYANVLKLRVLDAIHTFEPSNKEELEILCEITDGNQTDRNQKIICSRICALVNKTMPNKQWNRKNIPTIPRCHSPTS